MDNGSVFVEIMAIMLAALIAFSNQHSTPVIGGSCDLGSLDVQIGGKESLYFLRCIPANNTNNGKGAWIVKSRGKEEEPAKDDEEEHEIRRNIPTKHSFPICKKKNQMAQGADNSVHENLSCTITDGCYQSVVQPAYDASAYLKCDPESKIWVKKKCPENSYFSFEEQVCIEPRHLGSFHLYPSTTSTPATYTSKKINGILCTYTSCSSNNPCESGSCNDGYCCASAAPVNAFGNSCPADTTADGFCTNTNHCSEGCACNRQTNTCCCDASYKSYKSYKACPSSSISAGFCMNNIHCNKNCACNRRANTCCCPNSEYKVVSVCPNGKYSGGYCRSSNDCGYGCSCSSRSNTCCCRNSNNNDYTPIVICPDGSTSSGSCYSGNQCGNGCACVQNNCCCGNVGESSNGYTAIVICPKGTSNSGSCGSNNDCGDSCMCVANTCCCQNSDNGNNGIALCLNGEVNSNACTSNSQCGNRCYCNSQSSTCCCGNNNTNDRKNVIITIPKDMFCPDGTQAVGACVNGQCGTGFTCTNNICCAHVLETHQYKCLDGSEAIGACIDCKCGAGYFCTTGNLCCPSTQSNCPLGQVAVGPCVSGRCPSGYSCIGTVPNALCCGLSTVSSPNGVSCPLLDSIGPCVNDNCPSGYLCDTVNPEENRLCCPNFVEPLSAIGPCENSIPRCPQGYSCKTTDIDLPQCFRLDGVPTDTRNF